MSRQIQNRVDPWPCLEGGPRVVHPRPSNFLQVNLGRRPSCFRELPACNKETYCGLDDKKLSCCFISFGNLPHPIFHYYRL